MLLKVYQLEISPILVLHKRRMVSLLYNLPILKYRDDISILDRGKPMSHHDSGSASHNTIQCLLDHTLWLNIKRTRCFIKKKDGWIFYDGTGNGNPLLLTSRKLDASLPNPSWVAFWEGTYEGVCIRKFSCLNDLWFRGTILSIEDVLINGGGKECWFLLNKSNVFPQGLESKFPDVFIWKWSQKINFRSWNLS